MALKLDGKLRIGVITIHRRTEPAAGPWLPSIDELRELVELIDGCGYDSLWCGDHISFPAAILDPLLQLAQAAVVSRRLMLGTSVYLLPLRHPVPVAKQVATLDHLSEGRFIFGVGVGGEFAKEYEVCGVPHQRARAAPHRGHRHPAQAVDRRAGKPPGPLLRRFPRRPDAAAGAAARRSADLVRRPLRCGARPRRAAGRRLDRLRVTPEMYKTGPRQNRSRPRASRARGCRLRHRASALHPPDDTYEKALDAATATLSQRYAMDFRRAAERYAALGSPEQVADRIRAFHAAGARHITLDLVGPYEERDRQIEWFARDVLPLLADLR